MQRERGESRVAMVTGAAKRVGRAIAEALGAAGYSIAVHYRSSAREAAETAARIRSAGGTAETFRGDLSRVADIRHLVADVERRMGPIRILVNSASVFHETPFASVTEREWDSTLATNLKSVFFLSQAVAARMIKRQEGVIVNIEDVSVNRPYPRHAPYIASKAGVAMLTKALAVELGPHIRVAGVAPGPVLLPERFGKADREKAVRRTVLKREGRPEDVAEAVVFLATRASYTSGSTIFVDGGRLVA